MFRKLTILLFVAAIATGLLIEPAALFAQDKAELSKQFEKVLKEATPKTVMVRNKMPDGKREACGSGAIISADGYILTCSHVIVNASKIRVILPDGRELAAKMLGQNFLNDYALIKVEAKKLPFFELGESGKLKEGEAVMGLGYPGGQSRDGMPYVSYGRVLALGRNVPVQGFKRYYNGAIKSDMKSVPGNSGGPLVTKDGKLVGLNGAVMLFLERTYSIPVDAIKASLPELKAGKDVKGEGVKDASEFLKNLQDELSPEELKKFWEEARKHLGELEPKKMMEQLKKLFKDEIDLEKLAKGLEGLLGDAKEGFSEMLKELLGDEGLKDLQKELEKLLGDKEGLEELAKEFEKQLKEFEKLFGKGQEEKKEKPSAEPPEGDELDKEINKMLDELKKRFSGEDSGENKDGFREKLEKMLDEVLGDKKSEKKEDAVETPAVKAPYLGVRVSEAGDTLRYHLDLEGGLVVDEIKDGSPAKAAGLRTGDIIVEVDGAAIKTIEDMADIIAGKKPGDVLKFGVVAKGSRKTIEVTLGAQE